MNQSFADFELIIIDDGSTDNSKQVIDNYNAPHIQKIYKTNGGQLSSFNIASKHAVGDIVTFLDADDYYDLDYLKKLKDFFEKHNDCDFTACNLRNFGAKSDLHSKSEIDEYWGNHAFLSYVLHIWFGVPTSGCAIKRQLLNRFLPIPEIEKDWKIRADDILIWGADIVGARKYFIARPMVYYRIHQNNNYANSSSLTATQFAIRKNNALTFSNILKTKIDFNLYQAFENELNTIASKNIKLYWRAVIKLIYDDIKTRYYIRKIYIIMIFKLILKSTTFY